MNTLGQLLITKRNVEKTSQNKIWREFKSAYRKHKNQLQIGQNELKTILSAKEMLRNDAKTMYLVYER